MDQLCTSINVVDDNLIEADETVSIFIDEEQLTTNDMAGNPNEVSTIITDSDGRFSMKGARALSLLLFSFPSLFILFCHLQLLKM